MYFFKVPIIALNFNVNAKYKLVKEEEGEIGGGLVLSTKQILSRAMIYSRDLNWNLSQETSERKILWQLFYFLNNITNFLQKAIVHIKRHTYGG